MERKYKIITDKRTLRAFKNRYGFEYDNNYSYILNIDYIKDNIIYKGHEYDIKYISGCFYPYLVMYCE